MDESRLKPQSGLKQELAPEMQTLIDCFFLQLGKLTDQSNRLYCIANTLVRPEPSALGGDDNKKEATPENYIEQLRLISQKLEDNIVYNEDIINRFKTIL